MIKRPTGTGNKLLADIADECIPAMDAIRARIRIDLGARIDYRWQDRCARALLCAMMCSAVGGAHRGLSRALPHCGGYQGGHRLRLSDAVVHQAGLRA